MESEIRKELKEALKRASKIAESPILKTRIKIYCVEEGTPALYCILNGGTVACETTLKVLLDIGLVDILKKEAIVSSFFNVALGMLAGKNELTAQQANIRIYTKDENTNEPLIAFLNNDTLIKHVTAEEILELYMEYQEFMKSEQENQQ